jgi:Family of unknown function (DUF6174)
MLLVACPGLDTRPVLRGALETNRSLWAGQGIRSYRYTYTAAWIPFGFSFTVTVSNGVFQSAIDPRTGQLASEETVAGFKTVEAAFQTLSTQIEDNQLETVTYDSRGIPVNVQNKQPSCFLVVVDCVAGGSSITNFQALP